MNLDYITPLILTYNEQRNISATLKQLSWAESIIIIDSNSEDKTKELALEFTNVTFIQNSFISHANQWNFGLAQVKTDWVLTLDADYFITDQFLKEIQTLEASENVYLAPLKFCIKNIPLNCSILPARPVLFNPKKARYYDDGHTQRLSFSLPSKRLSTPILHQDRKNYSRWLANQWKYTTLEAKKLTETPFSQLRISDKVRRFPFLAAFLMPLIILLYKAGYKDGWRGFVYLFNRSLVETLLGIQICRLYFTYFVTRGLSNES